MNERPTLDLTVLSRAERILLAAAGLYLVWSFMPAWYSVEVPGGSGRIGAWNGLTTIAAIASLLAVAWVGLRAARVNVRTGVSPATVDVVLAGIGLVFTLLGLVSQPAFFGISWGLLVGIALALAWAYGGYLRLAQGRSGGASRSPGPPGP